jgi:hypothetical protein
MYIFSDMGVQNGTLNAEEIRGGRTPKTLGFFAVFGFNRSTRQLRRSSEGAGFKRGDFSIIEKCPPV